MSMFPQINPAQQDLRLPFDILHQATIFHYESTYHNNKTWGKTNNYCSEVNINFTLV